MQYRRLGRSGLEVSAIGLGTNAFGSRADKDTSIAVVRRALDLGVNLIDTADIYSDTRSEEILGEALAGRRADAVLATKAGFAVKDAPNRRGGSRQHLLRSVEDSLRRLRTDYIDLFQVHLYDPFTPVEETLRTLDDLVHQGKIRYVGTSNYAAWQLALALGESRLHELVRFESIQASYSLADRTVEQELQPLCVHERVSLLPYYPLAGGILTGKYGTGAAPSGSRAQKDPSFARRLDPERVAFARDVEVLAREANTTTAALSIAWLMGRPAVACVIVGATSPEQLESNLAALDVVLGESLRAALDARSLPYRDDPPFAAYRLE
ncbi:MAG: aldo/keto reductase [Thermaerobacter sp.]|nr:aldo/keto reductase [Thermaerobacter sp.]